MVIDYISNISRYGDLHPNFDKVVAFLQVHRLEDLPEGVTKIDGDNVYIKVLNYELVDSQIVWEAHKKYADIHIVLEGEERIGYCPEFLITDEAFPSGDAEDVVFYDVDGQLAELEPGAFAIFLPGEIHRPSVLCPDGKRLVKKAIVKVLCE